MCGVDRWSSALAGGAPSLGAEMSSSVLIVDDSSVFRYTVRRSVESNPQMRVCGEAENGEVALGLVRRLTPDIVILDVSMPIMNGLEAAREIAMIAPKTKIVLFSAEHSRELQEHARNIGVRAVLSKTEDNAQARLMRALEEMVNEPFVA